MLRILAKPNVQVAFAISWACFIVAACLYLKTAHARHADNPDDRIVPTISQLFQGTVHAAVTAPEEDDDSELGDHPSLWAQITHSMLWEDTSASGKRFLISLALMFPAVLIGLHMGAFPWVSRFLDRPVVFLDKIVALSVLPILFIAFGVGEFAKVMLIVIGVAPTIILDTYNLTKSVPAEQVIRGFTLGARDISVVYRVILPQIWPRILNTIRLNLKSIVLFLFAGEMIAAQNGLAYRIALMQRHMGMDVIIPYVLWTALLLFLADRVIRLTIRFTNPWFHEA